MGGILIWSNKQNDIRISNSKIYKNTKVGIHCIGEVFLKNQNNFFLLY